LGARATCKNACRHNCRHAICLILACVLAPLVLLCACSPPANQNDASEQDQPIDTSRFITASDDIPDTVDFQCTSLYYTVANNVFNRLVETEKDANGNARVVPSLAESWEVSSDGCSYTFHLRENVKFSNGSALTSSDVLYTFTRLLTHPNSCNKDIVGDIAGADKLERGESDRLEGFAVLNDRDFTITLEHPFEAFLPCLSMSGASIMDEQTTEAAGEHFGADPEHTIGTGPFILKEWDHEKGMLLVANPGYFGDRPRCDGVDVRFITEPEEARALFKTGELEILDLDEVPDYAEYYIHGDIYQEQLYRTQRIALSYVALNESIAPLGDVRVRKALQLGLDRLTLLDAVYSGRGSLENGIFPRGLYGHNPNLPEIPYDPEQAKALLQEAGFSDGFALDMSVRSSSTRSEMTLARLIVDMWDQIGVNATITVMEEDEFMDLRKKGQLACYTATWTADYNDPDNFIHTFFGSRDNTTFRSLCYQRDDVMERVHAARAITDAGERLAEYRALEQIIAQDDAAWIPLFSRERYYVMSKRVQGDPALWNGTMRSAYYRLSVNGEGAGEAAGVSAGEAAGVSAGASAGEPASKTS